MNIAATVSLVDQRARALRPGRVALTAAAVPLYAVGLCAGLLVRGLWLVASWLLAAAAVGWGDGFRRPPT